MTRSVSRRLFVAAAATSLLAGSGFALAQESERPAVIRIGSPELGSNGKSFPGAGALAIVRANQWLEQEFAKDGIKVEWTFFRGAGPAVAEALAARQLDVVFLGDLAAVIGRSRGLPTRLIAITGRESASYLAVAPGVTIKTPADLKGRKVAVLKGTAYQRPFDALLADAGLSEKDVRVVNMDWPTAKAAVVSKDVDATFGGADLHLLQDKGVTLPISTKGRGPAYNIHAAVLATDDFIGKYPQVTQRLVNQVVRASRWASDESNRPALIKLFGEHSGHGTAIYQADLQGTNLKTHFSPLLDEEALAAYKSVLADGQKWGLVRQGFDVDAWAAPQFVQAAVKTQKLDGYWPQLNAQGKTQP